MADNTSCPFCNIDQARILYADKHCFAVRDGFPVSRGHTLIIPRRHIGSFFDTTATEKSALLRALEQTKTQLAREYSPDAWDIGINDGPAAGQTVSHLHIHLIPKYQGDMADPRGGVRWVLPDKTAYRGPGYARESLQFRNIFMNFPDNPIKGGLFFIIQSG